MSKIRLLTFIVIGLFFTNLFLIGYLYKSSFRARVHEGPKRIIAERLHFDKNQIMAYDKLIAKHRFDITFTDSVIRQTKNKLYRCINSPNPNQKDSLIHQLGILQMDIERINYIHFLDIQKICTKNQLPYFSALVNDLADLFNHSKHRPKH
jgi:protein CpxP